MSQDNQENVNAIRAAYEAFAQRDIPAVLNVLDPQIHWHVPDIYPAGGTFHGREGVQQFFQGLGEQWEELNVDPTTFLAPGDHVVAIGIHRGRLTKNGIAVEVPFAHVWRVQGGKAVQFREYSDPGELLRAMDQ